jgi:hypothetical protein
MDTRTTRFPFAALGAGFTAGTYLTIASSTATSWPVPQPEILTCRIYALLAINRNASLRYLQIWAGPVPGQGAPFPTTPVWQVGLPTLAAAGPAPITYDDRYFGVSGLEFVGLNQQSGFRSKLPVSLYNSIPPNQCGVSIAISTTNGSYTAATASDHDLMGMFGT